jgi:Fe-S-cluster containining protein
MTDRMEWAMKNSVEAPPESTPTAPHAEVPEALRDRRQLAAGEPFSFGCHQNLECFTRCCADVNILLTPVDVLRLSRRLSMSTGEFLEKHTLTPVTKDLHLPVVMLRMGDEPEKRCSFVSDQGCGVYEDRPWSCRMYPLGMALPPARAGVEPEPVHFLFEDDFCRGGGEKQEWTVESWKENQQISEQEELESGFREIVSHPWFIGGRQLDPKRMEMFYTSCYDLDTFRRFVFSTTFTQRFMLEDGLLEQLQTDDEALLRFAFRWLRFALFGEPTIRVSAVAVRAAEAAVAAKAEEAAKAERNS